MCVILVAAIGHSDLPGSVRWSTGAVGRRCVGGTTPDVSTPVVGRGWAHSAKYLAFRGMSCSIHQWLARMGGPCRRGPIRVSLFIGGIRVSTAGRASRHGSGGLATGRPGQGCRTPSAVSRRRILFHFIGAGAARASNRRVCIRVVLVVLDLLPPFFFGLLPCFSFPPQPDAQSNKNRHGGDGNDNGNRDRAGRANALAGGVVGLTT